MGKEDYDDFAKELSQYGYAKEGASGPRQPRAVDGITGAKEAVEDLEAKAWAGAVKAKAPWEETMQRTRRTSMRRRWNMEKVRSRWAMTITMTTPRS
jgi:hypothetical protein